MIPEGWKNQKLNDIGTIITGNTPKTSIVDYYKNGSKLWASPSDLGLSKYIINTKTKLSDVGFEQIRKIPVGSILFTCIGSTIGKMGIASENMGTNQQINSIACNEKTHNEFIYYALSNKSDEIKSLAGIQAVPIVNKTAFGQTKILLPALPEQKKIATILSSIDESIQITQKVIDQTQTVKKGLLQELLTKGIEHSEFKKTEIGEIPVEWEVVSLISLSIDGISNGVFNDPKKKGKGYILINVVNLYDTFEIQIEKLGKVDITQKEFEVNKIVAGDIFFTRSSLVVEGIARCNIFLEKSNNVTFDGHIMKISPNTDKVEPLFLKYYCSSTNARLFFMSRAKTATMTTIGQKDIAPLLVPIPTIKEQKNIVQVISSIEQSEKIYRKKLYRLNLTKKGLMQDLLTGKVRVKV